MKKKLEAVMGLYPTPICIVGTVVEGRVNWVNIAHVGVIGMDRIFLSIGKTHYSNIGIKTHKTCSVNLINANMLTEADYVGIHSGKQMDKTTIFEYFYGDLTYAPMIENSPLNMECVVEGLYETMTHDNFIVRPVNTYVREEYLDEDHKIDFVKMSPVLFEMSNKQYLSVGEVIGKGWEIGNQLQAKK